MINTFNSNDKVLLIYHKEDNDGVFSAALIHKYLVDKFHMLNITPMGVTYADLSEIFKKKDWIDSFKEIYTCVVMTDISFNETSAMKKLRDTYGQKFVWIDHHAPIISASVKEGFNDIPGIRETCTSAIGLAYQFLFDPLNINFHNGNMPSLLMYLAGWDSWNPNYYDLDREECMKVNLAVNMNVELDLNKALSIVNKIMYGDASQSDYDRSIVSYYLINGEMILNYQKSQWKMLVQENAEFGWTVGGRSAVALFCQGPTTSQMFDCVKDEVKCAIVFKHDKSGDWRGSVYNTKNEYDHEFHCGTYLKSKYKRAGGHAGAAGFTLSQSKFLKVLKEKTL